MAITSYKLVRAPMNQVDAIMARHIADGFQPFGQPFVLSLYPDEVAQVIVKGAPDGGGGGSGAITSGSITDASEVGRAVLTAADPAAARTAVGASSLALGATATTAAAGNHSHSAATTTTAGTMAAADKSKLDGIAASATANDTDANLKIRANHTGSQAISTVTNLQAALDAKATDQALTDLATRVAALETP